MCREIMKMGCNSTDEREAVKEFVKALGSIGPHSWISKNTVRKISLLFPASLLIVSEE